MAIGLPHFLRLDAAPPAFAAGVWLCALLLRAVGSLLAVVSLEVFIPATRAYEPLSSVCALGVSGHSIGDAVLAIPTFLLAGALIVALLQLWRAARAVARLTSDGLVGAGPCGSVIVADGDLLVAAAGLRKPRILVSAGALLALDDEELFASLEHERGHIARGHRYVLVLAELARALGRLVPGTRAAARELLFHLERDADRFALARRHSPVVLASAICKAALHEPPKGITLALGGRGVVSRRVRQLLDNAPLRRPSIGLLTLVPVMIVLLAVAAGALPFVAHATMHHPHRGAAAEHC
ncbi:M56 family metallopeptidase [Candidatus Solirubrobacter pratensis]|uniref:M56 family metallopeptidase n=1 Tax=Candidatus Solirubrobacter pratensis TaxID=1298857 RepID=UPI0018C9712E|nr:M56 family metallopeptidase [Candidatus Solirubrobacter pratensis]